MSLRDLKVGDLICVVSRHSSRRECTPIITDGVAVAKVGRKYFTIDQPFSLQGQYNRETGWEKSDYLPNRAFADRAQWEAIERKNSQQERISRMVRDCYSGQFDNLEQAEVDELERLLRKLKGISR